MKKQKTPLRRGFLCLSSSEAIDGPDLATEAAKFADFWHAKAGKDATKVDWAGTWRNWIRNAHGKQRTPGRGQKHGGFDKRAYGEGGDL